LSINVNSACHIAEYLIIAVPLVVLVTTRLLPGEELIFKRGNLKVNNLYNCTSLLRSFCCLGNCVYCKSLLHS